MGQERSYNTRRRTVQPIPELTGIDTPKVCLCVAILQSFKKRNGFAVNYRLVLNSLMAVGLSLSVLSKLLKLFSCTGSNERPNGLRYRRLGEPTSETETNSSLESCSKRGAHQPSGARFVGRSHSSLGNFAKDAKLKWTSHHDL